jgi:long-chain acyl-CoA synthetase
VGPIIHEYYAGTEDIGHAHIGPQEWLAHPGSVAKPTTECHIVGPDGAELSAGSPGLLYFAGGRPFEYHNDPEETESITNANGWRTLGDIGYLDADGYLYLTDRQAHMIISGGVNIYPQEAENVLAGHPAVVDVAVIGVPDAEMGEAVKAVVQPVSPQTAGPELKGSCWRTAASGWPVTSARAASTSPTSSPGSRTASSTSACCASGPGSGTARW